MPAPFSNFAGQAMIARPRFFDYSHPCRNAASLNSLADKRPFRRPQFLNSYPLQIARTILQPQRPGDGERAGDFGMRVSRQGAKIFDCAQPVARLRRGRRHRARPRLSDSFTAAIPRFAFPAGMPTPLNSLADKRQFRRPQLFNSHPSGLPVPFPNLTGQAMASAPGASERAFPARARKPPTCRAAVRAPPKRTSPPRPSASFPFPYAQKAPQNAAPGW